MSFDLTFSRSDTALVRLQSGLYNLNSANQPSITWDVDGSFKGYRVPRTLNSIWRNSQNTGGSWVANDWGIGSAFTRMRTLNNSGGTDNEFDTGVTPATGDWATFGFFARSTNGAKPDVGSSNTQQLRLVNGGSGVTSELVSETELLNNVWFFCYHVQCVSGSPNANTGFQQSASYVGGVPVQVSEITIVTGQTTISPFDAVRTTGASATRALSDARNTSMPDLSEVGILLEADLRFSTTKRLYMWGNSGGTSYIGLRLTATQIEIQYVIGGSQVWSIISSVVSDGIYKIYLGLSNGFNYVYMNGVKISENAGAWNPSSFSVFALGRNITGTGVPAENTSFRQLYLDLTPSEARAVEMTS